MLTGTVTEALARAELLLDREPRLACAQADAVLEALPTHPQALLLRGAALGRLGELAAARAVLEPLAGVQVRAAVVQLEWGRLLAALDEDSAAVAALRRAGGLRADLPQVWRLLGDLLTLQGDTQGADAAYAAHWRQSVYDPALLEAADALARADLPRAERLLKAQLKAVPTDVAAMRMLAELAIRLGRNRAAEHLLLRCLELAPDFSAARHNYAVVLYRQNRAAEAAPLMQALVEAEPRDPAWRNLLAACLASTGEYDRAMGLYEGLLAATPGLPRLWLGYGHALRTAGRQGEAVAAYRRAAGLAPTLGEAWWSLANLKAGVLTPADAAVMRAGLAVPGLGAEDRWHLEYALGREREEAGEAAGAFGHYAAGAALRRAAVEYDPAAPELQVEEAVRVLTPSVFAIGGGAADPAPIFVVGLPRSGSTLLEQMLASHPLVEGTMELPELPNLVQGLGEAFEVPYPALLGTLPASARTELGRRYLARAQAYRKTDRPFFIDKLPNNWLHAGLIALILPQAKIVDARREAMATCFSCFTQHFARGQAYTYDLAELGRFYRAYLRMMAHMDAVAPGRVHRVQYEAMVRQTEATLRGLLGYCGLAFDPACLAFHENRRPVRTASSEQVRRPITDAAVEHWRQYEPWLGALRAALDG